MCSGWERLQAIQTQCKLRSGWLRREPVEVLPESRASYLLKHRWLSLSRSFEFRRSPVLCRQIRVPLQRRRGVNQVLLDCLYDTSLVQPAMETILALLALISITRCVALVRFACDAWPHRYAYAMSTHELRQLERVVLFLLCLGY